MGKRFGFDSNGQFINEIPNSQVITPLLATEQNVSLIYSLPADQDYMVDFSSTSLEGTQTSDFTQIGSNFYLSIIANSSQPLTNDHISIKKDGTEVFYRSGSDKEVNISLGLTKENKNYDYELSSLNINAGKAISLFEKGEDHLFIVSGAQSNSGSYQIKIKQPNISGERTFSASNISLAEGDTHSYVLDQWGLDGRMTLLIDHGSDGSIDKEIKLKNESPNPLSIWWIAGGGITILCCSTVVIGLIVFLFLYRRKRISAK